MNGPFSWSVSVAVMFGAAGVSVVVDGSLPRFPDPPKRPFARGGCDEAVSAVGAVGDEHPANMTRIAVQMSFRIGTLLQKMFGLSGTRLRSSAEYRVGSLTYRCTTTACSESYDLQ